MTTGATQNGAISVDINITTGHMEDKKASCTPHFESCGYDGKLWKTILSYGALDPTKLISCCRWDIGARMWHHTTPC